MPQADSESDIEPGSGSDSSGAPLLEESGRSTCPFVRCQVSTSSLLSPPLLKEERQVVCRAAFAEDKGGWYLQRMLKKPIEGDGSGLTGEAEGDASLNPCFILRATTFRPHGEDSEEQEEDDDEGKGPLSDALMTGSRLEGSAKLITPFTGIGAICFSHCSERQWEEGKSDDDAWILARGPHEVANDFDCNHSSILLVDSLIGGVGSNLRK